MAIKVHGNQEDSISAKHKGNHNRSSGFISD